MASRLKQQMRRSRGPVRPLGAPAPGEGVQTLQLEGKLNLKLGNHEVFKDDPELKGKRVFVGAWVNRDTFVHAERAPDGAVSLRVPVDTRRDVDTLKLQIYCLMEDPETRLSKPFPLAESVASLEELASGRPARVQFDDPIMGLQPSVLKVASTTRIDTSGLRRSAMHDVKASNDTMQALARRVGDAIKANKVRVPKVASAFIDGIGYLPSGGNAALGIPPVMTHYGALSGLVDRVERYLPHALLAYYLQLALTHEGLTIDQANALPDRAFAKLAGTVLWGTTEDAGAFPYQRDLTEAMTVSLTPQGFKVGIQPITSEDVGLPFAASNFIGRDLRLPDPTACTKSLLDLYRTDSPAPDAVYRACVAAVASGEWPELNLALGIDDCETSGMAGKLAANTVRDKDMGPEAFRRELAAGPDFGTFKRWTKQDCTKASAFFTRVQGMFKDGSLNISLVVGLAGGAAASTQTASDTGAVAGGGGRTIDEMGDLGGHCFAVLRHTARNGDFYVRLLEGTSCVKICTEAPDGPLYTVCMSGASADGKPVGARKEQALPLTRFLTLLSSVVAEETRVVNEVIGGGVDPGQAAAGLQAGRATAGFVRPTIVMRCLHSIDASSRESSEIGFYKWCLYTGLPADATDLGTLPLDALEYAKCLGAGCRPARLASPALQGFGIDMARPEFEVPRAVLDEVWPPIASPAQFKAVLALWAPLPPLSATNADLRAYRQRGVEYETVTCMETPAAPGLVEVVFRLKSALAALANKLNLARPDSDRIIMSVERLGTGVHATLHVPLRPLTLTFMASLREAKAQMGWGAAPEKSKGEGARY